MTIKRFHIYLFGIFIFDIFGISFKSLIDCDSFTK